MAPSLPAAAAAVAPALQPRLSFPYELHDPTRGFKGTYHDHQRLKAQFGERLRRRPRHRRPRGPQLPSRDCHDHRHDSGWSQDLEADIAAICCEAGLTGATATSVLVAARRGLVSANPGVLLAQLLALSTSLDPHLGPGAAAHALCACPSLLNHDAATLLFNYQATAPLFPPARVPAMYRTQSGLLVCSPFRVWSVLQQLAVQLDCSTDEAAAVAAQQPSLLLSSPTTLQQRQHQLAAAAGLSGTAVRKLLRGCPLLLTLSAVTLTFKYEELLRQLAPYVVLYQKRGRGRHKLADQQQQQQEQPAAAVKEPEGQPCGGEEPDLQLGLQLGLQQQQQQEQQQQEPAYKGHAVNAADVEGGAEAPPAYVAMYSSSSSSTQLQELQVNDTAVVDQPHQMCSAGQGQQQDCVLPPLETAAAAAGGACREPQVAGSGHLAATSQQELMVRASATRLQPAGALRLRAALQQGRTRAAGVVQAVRRAAARVRAAGQRQQQRCREQQEQQQVQALQPGPAATASSQLKARMLQLRHQQQQPQQQQQCQAASGCLEHAPLSGGDALAAVGGSGKDASAASAALQPMTAPYVAPTAAAPPTATGEAAAAAAATAAAAAAAPLLVDPLPRLTPQQRQVLQRVVCTAPTLLTLDPADLPRRLQQLAGALQLPRTELAQLLVRQPRLLTTSAATVAGKLVLMQELTGRTREQVCDMVYSAPALLTLSRANLATKWGLLWELTAPCITWRQQLVEAPPSTLAALLCCSEVRLRRLQQLSSRHSSSSSSSSVCSPECVGRLPATHSAAEPGAGRVRCGCSGSHDSSRPGVCKSTVTTTSSSSSKRCPLGSLPWRTLVRLSDAAYRDRMLQT